MIKKAIISLSITLFSLNTFAISNSCDVLTIPEDVIKEFEGYCQSKDYCGLSQVYKTNKDNVLLSAAESGEIAIIQNNINMDVSVNYIFSFSCRVSVQTINGELKYDVFEQGYESLLSKALMNDHMEIVDLLLSNGADLSFLGTFLDHDIRYDIAKNNNLEKLNYLLKQVNSEQVFLDRFFYDAVDVGNIEMLKNLIKRGANVNTLLDSLFGTLLIIPENKTVEEHIELLNVLKENGLKFNEYSKEIFSIYIYLQLLATV